MFANNLSFSPPSENILSRLERQIRRPQWITSLEGAMDQANGNTFRKCILSITFKFRIFLLRLKNKERRFRLTRNKLQRFVFFELNEEK